MREEEKGHTRPYSSLMQVNDITSVVLLCSTPGKKKLNVIKSLDHFQEVQGQRNMLKTSQGYNQQNPSKEWGNSTGQTVALT